MKTLALNPSGNVTLTETVSVPDGKGGTVEQSSYQWISADQVEKHLPQLAAMLAPADLAAVQASIAARKGA